MNTVITIIFVLACLVLIASVLMHSGRSAGLSGSITGGAEQLFGKSKGKELDKVFDRLTKIAAVIFILAALAMVAIQ